MTKILQSIIIEIIGIIILTADTKGIIKGKIGGFGVGAFFAPIYGKQRSGFFWLSIFYYFLFGILFITSRFFV
ncbi:hypothetical protein KJ903_02105 [Patescibacteria group bacterium]|nr:hypothetical protein [Patescibacteria group bacterium]